MLAISRLAAFHSHILARDLHTVVLALVYEVRNLRSTVARSAIYTLGDLLVKMKKQIEPVREGYATTLGANVFCFYPIRTWM
jgi:hypothetical protein